MVCGHVRSAFWKSSITLMELNVQIGVVFRTRRHLEIRGPGLRLCVQLDPRDWRLTQCAMGSNQLPECHQAHNEVECLVVRPCVFCLVIYSRPI